MNNMIKSFWIAISILLGCTTFVLFDSCTASNRIKDGATAFERKQFALAADLLLEEYQDARTLEQQAKFAYLLGESFRRMNRNEQALPWYRQAYELDYGAEALYSYAQALKSDEQYEAAARAFEELQRSTGRIAEYRREITICMQAIQWKRDQLTEPFEVKPLPGNTTEAEYAPFLVDPDFLLFTSDGAFTQGKDIYAWTGNRFSDLFLRNLKNGELVPLGEPINSNHNEGTASFNRERNQIYFTRCAPQSDNANAYCSIYTARRVGDAWTEPEALPWSTPDYNEGHAFLAPSGQVLFFSSDRPEGQGGYDIWLSRNSGEGWEQPINLGPSINTPSDEKFPTMDRDSLYFSSDGWPGMGGLDIFKTYLLNNGRWAPPMNMRAPVNSGGDDFYFTVNRFKKESDPVIFSGFFSSSRKNGVGNDDLYRFEYLKKEAVEDKEEKEGVLYLAVQTVEPEYDSPNDPNSTVLRWNKLANTDLTILAFGDQPIKKNTDRSGLAIVAVPWRSTIRVQAKKEGYLGTELDIAQITPAGNGNDSTVNIELRLEPIIAGVEILLRDIYYDFDKWDIREDARPSLNRLAMILENNPEIRIELNAHTDCRGDEAYNLDLSQKRAQSAVDYLIRQGINQNRLVAKGFGESQLVVDCVCELCTEEEHQVNRRTTFKIIESN